MSNKLEGITLQAEGEANCYRMMRGGNWLASIRMNGELLVWDQEAILNAMLSSEQPAADPVQDIALQLGIQTFGDGLLAKIRQTIDLLQEAAAERDQLRAEVERLEDALETETMRLAACGVAALGYFQGCAEEYDSASLRDVLALRAQLAQQQGVPEGWKLVPEKMLIDAASIEALAFVMGGPEEDDGSPTYCDCVMWVGEIDDDGVKRHGIHVYNTECEEEGSTTLAEFAAAPAPVQLPVGYVHFKAPVAEPASPWVAVSERIEEAFQFGFNAPVTYNDVLENDVAEAWEKEKVYLLRPLPAGPEVAP